MEFSEITELNNELKVFTSHSQYNLHIIALNKVCLEYIVGKQTLQFKMKCGKFKIISRHIFDEVKLLIFSLTKHISCAVKIVGCLYKMKRTLW